jgi:drug/metabolite transporter (DMT)-like permease
MSADAPPAKATVEPTRGQASARRTDLAALAAGLTTVTLWGSAFVGIRAVSETLAPGTITLGRLIVSSLILGVVALIRSEPLPPRRALLPISVFGALFLGAYSVVLNAAERHVDAGTSAMIVNTGPLLIAILAGVFLHEGFPHGLYAGCAVAVGGCILIGVATHGSGNHVGYGIALLATATLAYASAVVVQKKALARATSFQVTWLGCTIATVLCLPFAPTLIHQTAHASARAVGWTIYLGAMPTALGFATWSFALGQASAGRVASLNYLIPVVAILLGWAYLGERPPLLAIGGGTLCIAGVYLARRTPRRT